MNAAATRDREADRLSELTELWMALSLRVNRFTIDIKPSLDSTPIFEITLPGEEQRPLVATSLRAGTILALAHTEAYPTQDGDDERQYVSIDATIIRRLIGQRVRGKDQNDGDVEELLLALFFRTEGEVRLTYDASRPGHRVFVLEYALNGQQETETTWTLCAFQVNLTNALMKVGAYSDAEMAAERRLERRPLFGRNRSTTSRLQTTIDSLTADDVTTSSLFRRIFEALEFWGWKHWVLLVAIILIFLGGVFMEHTLGVGDTASTIPETSGLAQSGLAQPVLEPPNLCTIYDVRSLKDSVDPDCTQTFQDVLVYAHEPDQRDLVLASLEVDRSGRIMPIKQTQTVREEALAAIDPTESATYQSELRRAIHDLFPLAAYYAGNASARAAMLARCNGRVWHVETCHAAYLAALETNSLPRKFESDQHRLPRALGLVRTALTDIGRLFAR